MLPGARCCTGASSCGHAPQLLPLTPTFLCAPLTTLRAPPLPLRSWLESRFMGYWYPDYIHILRIDPDRWGDVRLSLIHI